MGFAQRRTWTYNVGLGYECDSDDLIVYARLTTTRQQSKRLIGGSNRAGTEIADIALEYSGSQSDQIGRQSPGVVLIVHAAPWISVQAAIGALFPTIRQ